MRGAWQATIVDDEGNVQPFASVEVRDQAGGLVSLFDAETGGSAITNPFDADSEGFARFYCDPQLVDIEATTASGIRAWDNVLIPGTAAAQDVEVWRQTSTVTGNHTVESPPAYGTSIVNVDAATATITIPEGVPIGGRVHVRKINSTQGTVSISRSGTDTITRAALTSVSLNADGDNWLLEKVSAARWELIAGVESGENSDGEYWRWADGAQIFTKKSTWDGGTNSFQAAQSYPADLISGTDYSTIGGTDSGSSANADIIISAVVLNSGGWRVAFRGTTSSGFDVQMDLVTNSRWYE